VLEAKKTPLHRPFVTVFIVRTNERSIFLASPHYSTLIYFAMTQLVVGIET